MAQRRMFSLQIVDSDAFLDMPTSTQSLYFHLAMRADDDGFVGNPKKIIRGTNASDDDFKILLAKRFVLSFESGVIVIKHWKMHNYIQKDRYNETQYLEEKSKLQTKENGAYTECIQGVHKTDTQVRIGKVRIGKVNTTANAEENEMQISEEYSKEFLSFWNSYPNKKGKGNAWKAWKKIKGVNKITEKIIASVVEHKEKDPQWKKDGGQFIPHPSTFLNQARWEDEIEVETLKESVSKF